MRSPSRAPRTSGTTDGRETTDGRRIRDTFVFLLGRVRPVHADVMAACSLLYLSNNLQM